jgi:hypothetical protein
LRRQPPTLLAREAAWRFWKPYRSARLLAEIRRGDTRLQYRPVPYFQPDLSRAAAATVEITGYADLICAGKFPFLGYETADLGFPPNWHRDFVSGFEWEQAPAEQVRVVRYNGSDVKIPWDLSRLQFLPVLAKAHLLTGESRYREAAKDLLANWLARNPVGVGINWTLAMETGLRGMSLCYLLSLLQPLRPDEESWGREVVRSIWQHMLYTESCLEFSHLLRSNHYLGNIVGLHCMATFLEEPGMERRRIGYRKRVQGEILRQVYEDGGDYEASFGYHLLALQMFASSYLLMRAENLAINPSYTARVRSMFAYLAELADENGCIPHVGDTDDGRVELLNSDLRQMLTLPPETRNSLVATGFIAIGDALFELGCCGDPSDAAWYGLVPAKDRKPGPRLTVFPNSGVAVGRSDGAEVVFCAIPNGIHGSGSHTHNDKLSVVARIDGTELLCDSGTYWYTRDTRLRNMFRATSAHNTIAIDGAEQNEINPDRTFAFCVANQATVGPIHAEDASGEVRMTASHAGYGRVGVEHRRTVRLGPRGLSIEDVLSGSGEHSFEIFWHLPSIWSVTREDGSGFHITGPSEVTMSIKSELPVTCARAPAEISRTYGGATEMGTVLRAAGAGQFPCTVTTAIAWTERAASAAAAVAADDRSHEAAADSRT